MLSHATPTPTAKHAHAANPAHRRSSRLGVLLLLLIGFALRLFHLGSESLWYDETVSAYLATQPIPELIAHTARDIHPPAYYLLLHGWRLLANPTVDYGLEYLYAWPSLGLAMLVMAFTYTIARRCFSLNAARWALAFALVHPLQVWFAQEVRMYALGAFCLMLTLWAASSLLRDPVQRQSSTALPLRMCALYLVAALLGLYTLYYFLFWLVVLNLGILLYFWFHLWRNWETLRRWLLLQLLVLAGWLPWLPTFLRQATTPPVPAWRVPWQSATEIAQALSEGIAAILVGHTPPLALNWPWAILCVGVGIAFYVYTKSTGSRYRFTWLLLCFGPLILLLGVSLVGPSIYHVRYLATYAPLFAILVGALLANIPRLYATPVFLLLTAISCLSLYELWNNPRYAADDHRSAVAALAHQWRPGDVIIVNAGWVYTAIDLYWPRELSSPNASRPPAIAATPRLTNLSEPPMSLTTTAPVIYRTGSIDGPGSLGWGLPESDFFTLSQTATTNALAQLSANYTRLWHYRLYDTVSDPNALIRTWLDEHTAREYSQPFPGSGFLLLEGYRTPTQVAPPESTGPESPGIDITYPDAALRLTALSNPATLPAGETLYVTLNWQGTKASLPAQAPALSLRLYDPNGQLVLQSDTPVTSPFSANRLDKSTQSLALPIPADTIPGDYTLSLVVYAPDTLAPYAATASDDTPLPSPTPLDQLAIRIPVTLPHTPPPQATFDYIDLLQGELPTTPLAPGTSFATTWTWRPQASSYTDNYMARLQLGDDTTQPVATWDFALGTQDYPSSTWPAGYPLTHRVESALPSAIPPGIYQVHLSLTRTSDGKAIPARRSWQPWQQPSVNVGQLEITLEE